MALLNLKSLNESLEKLYGVDVDATDYPAPLNESLNEEAYSRDELMDKFGTDDLDIINAGNEEDVSLKEAFDPSWPKWMRDRMSDLSKMNNSKYNNWRSNWKPQTNNGMYADYKNTRDEDKYSRGAWNNFASKGIPLDKLPVTEGPVPEKRTDERLKNEDLIPVWGFPNGQVYIPGFNDSEIYQNLKANNKDLYDRAFKYIGTKYLMSEADKFATINKSDISGLSGARDVIKTERRMNRPDPEFDRTRKPSAWQGQRKDKSGYIVDPKKYEKKLARLRASNIYAELDRFYDTVMDYKIKVHDYLSTYDPFMDHSGTFSSTAEVLMDKLSAVAARYNRYCKQVEDVLTSSFYSSRDSQLEALADIIKRMRDDSDLKSLQEYGKDKFYSDIDWE